MKRLLVFSVLGLMAALALAALLVLRRFDPERLGESVLGRVAEKSGAEIRAERASLAPLRGLVLEGIELRAERPGRRLQLTADRLVLEHDWTALFSGVLLVESARLLRPRLELFESPASAAGSGEAAPREPSTEPPQSADATAEPGGRGEGLELAVREVVIEEGWLQLRTGDGAEASVTTLEGVEVRLRDIALEPGAPLLSALTAAGDLEARAVALDDLELEDVRGRLAAREGIVVLEKLRAITDLGKAEGRLQADFRASPFLHTFSIALPDLNLTRLLNAEGASVDAQAGAASFDLQAEGRGSRPEELRGSGLLTLEPGRLPAAPVFVAIDRLVGENVLAGAPYEASPVRFQISDGQVLISDLEIETAVARLTGGGSATLAGGLDFQLSLGTPRAGIDLDGVGGDILDLLSDDAGWVTLSLGVGGDLERPHVVLDTDALLERAKGGAVRSLEDLLEEGLRRLLEGDEEEP